MGLRQVRLRTPQDDILRVIWMHGGRASISQIQRELPIYTMQYIFHNLDILQTEGYVESHDATVVIARGDDSNNDGIVHGPTLTITYHWSLNSNVRIGEHT